MDGVPPKSALVLRLWIRTQVLCTDTSIKVYVLAGQHHPLYLEEPMGNLIEVSKCACWGKSLFKKHAGECPHYSYKAKQYCVECWQAHARSRRGLFIKNRP